MDLGAMSLAGALGCAKGPCVGPSCSVSVANQPGSNRKVLNNTLQVDGRAELALNNRWYSTSDCIELSLVGSEHRVDFLAGSCGTNEVAVSFVLDGEALMYDGERVGLYDSTSRKIFDLCTGAFEICAPLVKDDVFYALEMY